MSLPADSFLQARLALPRFGFLRRRREEFMICKRREHGDDRDADECGDAIELADLGKVVKEKFKQRHAKQNHG